MAAWCWMHPERAPRGCRGSTFPPGSHCGMPSEEFVSFDKSKLSSALNRNQDVRHCLWTYGRALMYID